MLQHNWTEPVGSGCEGRWRMQRKGNYSSDLTGNSLQFDPIVFQLTGWKCDISHLTCSGQPVFLLVLHYFSSTEFSIFFTLNKMGLFVLPQQAIQTAEKQFILMFFFITCVITHCCCRWLTGFSKQCSMWPLTTHSPLSHFSTLK